MIRLDYDIDKKELEKHYMNSLFSTKFGNGAEGKTIEEKFDDLKKTYPYSVIFYDVKFKDLIFVTPDKLKCTINKIETKIIEQSDIIYKTIKKKKVFVYKVKEELKAIFAYEKFQPFIATFFEQKLSTRTCYYCNIHFVNKYRIDGENYNNEFTLDHYYGKGSYPYMALSLYNLIPSCYTCNSNLKKTNQIETPPPNAKNFDFDQKVKFKLFLSDSCHNLHITDKEDIEISLKERYSNQYDKYIEIFRLNVRYQAHKDIVLGMLKNAELYPESRLRELQDLTGIPYQQIKKDIFNLIDEGSDLSKEPFSKLILDISQELNLIPHRSNQE